LYESDQIDLLYVLRPHGWSELLLYVGGEVQQICVSHVFSSPTGDLIRLAHQLLTRRKSMALLLWDEPGGHSLTFEQVADQHHLYLVRLSSFPEDWPSERRTESLILEFCVKADHFLKLIYAELSKVLTLLEDKTYRKYRDFPYQEFKGLCEAVEKI